MITRGGCSYDYEGEFIVLQLQLFIFLQSHNRLGY